MTDLFLAALVLVAASAGIVIWQFHAAREDRKSAGLRAANRDGARDRGERDG